MIMFSYFTWAYKVLKFNNNYALIGLVRGVWANIAIPRVHTIDSLCMANQKIEKGHAF
jgi:hypothetical protein